MAVPGEPAAGAMWGRPGGGGRRAVQGRRVGLGLLAEVADQQL